MSIPFELPMKASEAAALADIIFQMAEGKPLTEELRQRLANRAALLNLQSVTPYFGSLQKDPTHQSTYYLAVDGLNREKPQPLLLHIAPASAPASALFPQSFLIGRMRPGGGREVVVNGVPFSSYDGASLRAYASKVDRSFLPRPQGSQSAIAAGNRHPEISLPAVFVAFRTILKKTGLNLASTVQLSATREMSTDEVIAARDGENPLAPGHTRVSIRHLYEAGLWAAIRAGWRDGYNAEADHFIISGNNEQEIAQSVEATKVAIEQAADYTKFTTDTSRLFELRADLRHPDPWSDTEVEDRFYQILTADEAGWLLEEFSKPFSTGQATYHFTRQEVLRLGVKFCRSLKLNEELYDHIRRTKIRAETGKAFDFEPSIDEAETLTTPKELLFYMHWLKSRGRPAQLIPPNLGFKKRQPYPVALDTHPDTGVGLRDYVLHKMWPELLPRVIEQYDGKPLEEFRARVNELAAVARYFNGTLSIHSGSGKQAEVLEQIARATAGRWNYKISGELQLQLFDVLSEQPLDSPWRQLYERMVDRCHQFAAQGAFGEESQLAQKYLSAGKGSYLGDPARGRVDGNLFLVFWLGNVNGSRDLVAPDGDHRFFKEKLDELPADLVEEVRRRNTAYIIWLADQLRG
ncbi:MAG: tagaturonate epimerase family protein [Bryobacteraceae bacterium]|nr:tagaturonate epimerase family protein [Bryobacteraceae bacterium]MDW8378726.1 tagaturonate epimerase family protein [Bryobacterales bacterium]